MPYITREDGERFVIPSYRDVLTVTQTSQLKKDIQLLCQSYGEYITLQKKSPTQYEVAFSPETGYLLGESIWHHFNKPLDMIYCEAIPNTTEAILVIVKSGSVYLDGTFPLDSIPEELIVFLTQQNNFEIYTYGDVPISEQPEAGKFSFEASSVKSFKALGKPAFPTLPLLKSYQLQLMDTVLKAHGIGVFPMKSLLVLVVLLGVIWAGYTMITQRQKEEVVKKVEINPYQAYNTALSSPAPEAEVIVVLDNIRLLLSAPGWQPTEIDYIRGVIIAKMVSYGGKVSDLYAWAAANKASVDIKRDGMYLKVAAFTPKRNIPATISPMPKVIGALVDRIGTVYPGNHLTLGDIKPKGVYNQVQIDIKFVDITIVVLDLLGKELTGLPLVLQNIKLTVNTNGNLSGSLTLDALGN